MTNLPHFIKFADDGVPEYYLDHTIMSTFRMCEERFMLDYIHNYFPKIVPWPLSLGTLIHDVMEFYYAQHISGKIDDKATLEYAADLWRTGQYDRYAELSQFKALGGFKGFMVLIAQYIQYYEMGKDNLKPIALEIPFGKNKEVPLLEDATLFEWAPFRLYLSGRVDFIFDNGRKLGPMDHKSFSIEGKNPMQSYEVQEGMTGYIYAMNYIKQKHFPTLDRETNVLWLNMIHTKLGGDLNKRFQRIPLYKTTLQLDEYRIRQISTVAKIHQVLFNGRPADWNGGVCTNWFHGTCHYQQVHRQGSAQDRQTILSREFVTRIWDTENVKGIEVKKGDNNGNEMHKNSGESNAVST